MARPPADSSGPRLFEVYLTLNLPVTYERFCEICTAQGHREPSRRMFAHLRRLTRARKSTYMTVNSLDVELRERRAAWTLERVEALVGDKVVETAHLEFKREAAGSSTTTKAWAALANSGGGAVVYGVDEDDLSRAMALAPVELDGLRERFHQLNRSIDPPVDMSIEVLPDPTVGAAKGFAVVRIEPAALGRVHLVDHRAPVRDGTTTRYMTSEELRRWVVEAHGVPQGSRADACRDSGQSTLPLTED